MLKCFKLACFCLFLCVSWFDKIRISLTHIHSSGAESDCVTKFLSKTLRTLLCVKSTAALFLAIFTHCKLYFSSCMLVCSNLLKAWCWIWRDFLVFFCVCGNMIRKPRPLLSKQTTFTERRRRKRRRKRRRDAAEKKALTVLTFACQLFPGY